MIDTNRDDGPISRRLKTHAAKKSRVGNSANVTSEFKFGIADLTASIYLTGSFICKECAINFDIVNSGTLV
jgi:hypothetical protein